jgi:hypothetical protein
MGSTKKLGVCADGMTPSQWEKESAKKAGLTVPEWRERVVQTLNEATGDSVRQVFGSKGGRKAGYYDRADSLAREFRQVSTAFAPAGTANPGPTAWSSGSDLGNLLDGKVPGLGSFAGNGSGYNQHKRPMWWYLWRKGLAYEADWQQETAISWVDVPAMAAYRDAKKKYDAAKKKHDEEQAAYAKQKRLFAKGKLATAPTPPAPLGPAPTPPRPIYADPANPFVVSRRGTEFDWAKGTIVKLTASEAGSATGSTYAQVVEQGPTGEGKLEASLGAWRNMGYSDVTPTQDPAGVDLGYSTVASGGSNFGGANVDSYLTGDDVQLAGALGESGMLSRTPGKAVSVSDLERSVQKNGLGPDDVPEKLEKNLNEGGKRALKRIREQLDLKKAMESGRFELMRGFATVLTGKDQRRVAYADAECLHSGGGFVKEGSATVYVGKHPLGRVDDGTSDGYAIKTGSETVFVGGPPTSTKLA